ncbi:MAG: class 1 fructose-bisphosphatase [Chloroflexi bacterium]|nr:class 1 fructose-bisphosphatase [Chloroflexota bacterium]
MTAKIITIERHFLEQQRFFPQASGEFTNLLYDIALAAKIISREVNKAGLAGILGLAGAENIQGEQVMKLDVFANETIIRMNDHTGRLCIMASEEIADIIPIPEQYPCGKYVLVFDPLDGSSNIDVNASVGTIFSIHRKVSDGPRGSLEDLLQPGYKQVAAGYIVYGSSTMMVYSSGQGVHGFTLDPTVGEFLLSHPDIQIPPRGKYYSVNEGNYHYWGEGVRRYVDYLKTPDPSIMLRAGEAIGRPYSSRYMGTLVADFHRNLLAGGIFMYPADSKDPRKPRGKLRLLYEAAPLAFIVEQAGGRASDGTQDIMHIQPASLHQRVPLFIGSREDVGKAEEFIGEFG